MRDPVVTRDFENDHYTSLPFGKNGQINYCNIVPYVDDQNKHFIQFHFCTVIRIIFCRESMPGFLICYI